MCDGIEVVYHYLPNVLDNVRSSNPMGHVQCHKEGDRARAQT